MNRTADGMLRKILYFAAFAEFATGLVLLVDPALVVTLLIGAPLTGAGVAAGRCFGAALLALGIACRPSRQHGDGNSRAAGAMFVYNALIALYLGYLGVVEHAAGVFLWPVVAVHAAVALMLVWSRRVERLDVEAGTSQR